MTIEDRIIIKWERRGVNIKWQRWMRGKTGRLAGTRFQNAYLVPVRHSQQRAPTTTIRIFNFFFSSLEKKWKIKQTGRKTPVDSCTAIVADFYLCGVLT